MLDIGSSWLESNLQPPRRAHLAGEHGVALVGSRADEVFGDRVPVERDAQPQRDGAEVADRDRAVADLDVADRSLAALDAVHEVAHVIVGYVETMGVLGQRLLQQLGITGLDPLAVDEDPALSPMNRLPFSPSLVVTRRAPFA